MATNIVTFYATGRSAPAGALVRRRFYNGDGAAGGNDFKGTNVVEIGLTEKVLANNDGNSDYNGSATNVASDSLLLPYRYEDRKVTAQTTVAFDDVTATGASILTACGDFGFLVSGAWVPALAFPANLVQINGSTTVDGHTPATLWKVAKAVLTGQAVVSVVDGTHNKVSFKANDGTTEVVAVTFDASGNRTASVITP